jgi:hypothetical protein
MMKKSDNSMEISELAKIQPRHRASYSLKEKPPTRSFLEDVAQDSIKVARYKDDVIRRDEIYHYVGIPLGTYKDWIRNYPDIFRPALTEIDSFIAIRREKGAVIKDKKTHHTPFTAEALRPMSIYDEDWREMEERKKAKGDTEGNFTIVIPSTEQLAAKEKELEGSK